MKRLTTLFLIIALLAAALGALAEQPSAETAARSVVPENAELLRTKKDDGMLEYHFAVPDGTRYQVDIHPGTLEVWKLEIDLPKDAPLREQGMLTADEAKALALLQVEGGVVTRLDTDRDDGRLEYEGELTASGIRYEFTIDAETGILTEWERER